MKLFYTQGWLEGQSQSKRDFPVVFDGKKLDELTIVATVSTMKEVERLIEFLQIQKHCFWTPEDNARKYQTITKSK